MHGEYKVKFNGIRRFPRGIQTHDHGIRKCKIRTLMIELTRKYFVNSTVFHFGQF
jgi:hypothetical protein